MKSFEDIKKITIPFDLPNGPGPINFYLFCGSPLSLIDTGIKGQNTLRYIDKGLEGTGFKIEDLDRIYITHGHIDHFGMARRLSEISGAKIFVHSNDKDKVQVPFEVLFERDFPLVMTYFKEAGVHADSLEGYYQSIKDLYSTFADPIGDGVETLSDGEIVDCGERKLKVIHLPGHTSGTVGFYDDEGLLIAGDHLLAEITPNPLLDLSAKARNGYKSLKSYLSSLTVTKKHDISLVLPGHGRNIHDPPKLISQFLGHHEERKKEILTLLSENEKTKWELSCLLFGELQTREIYLGLSEVEGHLELLEEERKVVKRKKEGILYYSSDL
ncbi:MAG: MBL fold metallo-hydrolase [Desulfobacterales bacterium]|jgi:glyoxylase-like metal-dependent hydrolase (beta-lactamase superfamily II)